MTRRPIAGFLLIFLGVIVFSAALVWSSPRPKRDRLPDFNYPAKTAEAAKTTSRPDGGRDLSVAIVMVGAIGLAGLGASIVVKGT